DGLIERYLTVIRERARTEQNGASWQVSVLLNLESEGYDRSSALAEMTRRYWQHMHSNEPVHLWPLK
ncbi:MAG: glutamate--cysteine ligase, partial [Arthrobacter sp.]